MNNINFVMCSDKNRVKLVHLSPSLYRINQYNSRKRLLLLFKLLTLVISAHGCFTTSLV